MRPFVLFAVVLLAGTAVTTVSEATSSAKKSEATSSARNGKIVFRRFLDLQRNRGVIFTISPNGTGERRLTVPGDATDDEPVWTPDGSRIAFTRQFGADTAIYTMRPDGTGLKRVSPACPLTKPRRCEGSLAPGYAPSGRELVYASWDGRLKGAIAIIGSDGRNRRVVVPASSSASLSDPQFSPTGDRIVFERVHLGNRQPKDARAIFLVNVDGSGLVRVTPWKIHAGDPHWSPDGKWILFGSNEHLDDKVSQIYLIHPDGTGLRQLTHFKLGTLGSSAAFSPDGRWIVATGSGVGGQGDLSVMRIDGTSVRQLTRTKVWDSAPDWGSAR
jgi:TolB protein